MLSVFGAIMMSSEDPLFNMSFDPYQTLKDHDEWIVKIAQHMEQLAASGKSMADLIQRQEGMIRHLTAMVANQQKLIIRLNQRLEKVESE